MARRKRVLDDGDDSDSSNNSDMHEFDDLDNNDPDAREERALFEDPYQRKRRRKNGKEEALYGVFAEASEDEGFGRKRPTAKAKRSDWTKAPAFVSSDKKVDLDVTMDGDLAAEREMEVEKAGTEDVSSADDGSEGEDDADDGNRNNSDESEASRTPSPHVHIEDDDEPFEQPQSSTVDPEPLVFEQRQFTNGGLGSSRGGIGSSKGGIGSRKGAMGSYSPFTNATASSSLSSTFDLSRGGIGSKSSNEEVKDASSPAPSLRSTPDLPSAFGNRSQRFTGDSTPSTKAAALSAQEMAHFNKLQGSFGARMLEKMGWQAGTGLGTSGEGIVTPIESKLRPQKMGIAFKGFKEKTEQSKREAKRRGEAISDEDGDPKVRKLKKKAKEAEKKRSDVWKRPKKVKTKIEHKTYEQIIAEAGDAQTATGLGQIIDATGAVPREVSSLSEISLNTWAPSNDPTRIPEVRHNIRLIADACKSDLDGLAREGKGLQERKKYVIAEDLRLRKKVEEEAELISRLQQIQLVAGEIHALSKELASVYEVSLEPFSPFVHQLVDRFPDEFDKYQLDEVVVAAIAPLVRRMVSNWKPLEEPTAFLSTFRSWRRALKVDDTERGCATQVDAYGTQTTIPENTEERAMTPFESLLWNVWLPKVRTTINNEWSPYESQSAVRLYESWSSFLPPFIRDNILDQLILPKIQKAVADWNSKRPSVPLQSIVFPWLPYVGLRLEDILGDAKRKVKGIVKGWGVGDTKPSDLMAWKDVFDASEWDAMMLKYIVPKLGAILRNDFRVNPRAQIMEPLHQVLAWSDLIRSSIFSQILETEFFPKWLDVLHIWLIQPKVSFEEVAQWYRFWKDTFTEAMQNTPGVSRGLIRGLQLMNKAIELGPDAPTQLQRPDFRAELAAGSKPPRTEGKNGNKRVTRPSARTYEITFRSIVEEYAAQYNLLFIPTGRAHERSRMPLFRVSTTADGKHGLLVYILDDAVWAPRPDGMGVNSEEFRAISLEDMVSRAAS